MFAHARPGTSDTSAIATDQVHNPGTMNAIINTKRAADVPRRKGQQVAQGRRVHGRRRELLVRAGARQQVLAARHGDRDGPPHPEGRRGLDRRPRGDPARLLQHRLLLGTVLGQPPHRPAPARSDRPPLTDRRRSTSGSAGATAPTSGPSRTVCRTSSPSCPRRRPTPPISRRRAPMPCASSGPTRPTRHVDLERDLDKAVRRERRRARPRGLRRHLRALPLVDSRSRGRRIQEPRFPRDGADRHARATGWARTSRSLATEVGTDRCRALHSNHMTGHVWQEYGSETLRARPPDPNIKEPHDGGRGYYRNISLLSAWAHAPFMHNNAIGPELCGKPANRDNDFYRSPYVDAGGDDAATRQGAGVLGLRPDRRGPLQAVRRVDERTPQSGQADAQDRRASTRTCASSSARGPSTAPASGRCWASRWSFRPAPVSPAWRASSTRRSSTT